MREFIAVLYVLLVMVAIIITVNLGVRYITDSEFIENMRQERMEKWNLD